MYEERHTGDKQQIDCAERIDHKSNVYTEAAGVNPFESLHNTRVVTVQLCSEHEDRGDELEQNSTCANTTDEIFRKALAEESDV